MHIKKSILVTATMATVALGGVGALGVASAATTTTADPQSSIVDRLASKFNLNKSDVQAVFDEDRSAHQADMAAKQKERLTQAVTDGKLTQAQADYITKAQAEIATLRGTGKPGSESDTTKTQLKEKTDALKAWAKTNNVDEKYVMGMGGHGGPMGGPRGEKPADAPAATDN